MKFKTVAVALGAMSLSLSGMAFANTSVAQLQAKLNHLKAQVNAMSASSAQSHHSALNLDGFVRADSKLVQQTMSTQTGVATEANILKAKKADHLTGHLYFGAQMKGYATYSSLQNTLGTTTQTTHMGIASDTGIAVLANVNQWASAFVSLDGLDTAGNVTAKDAYALIGNLNQSPFYGFAGRKDIDFGSFQSVNFYTAPINRQVFEANANTLGVGYMKNGLNAVVSFMNGGQSTRLHTADSNNINNFALNASYSHSNNGINWKVGAGYLNGVSYGTHGIISPVYDINAQLTAANVKVIAEYTQTFHAIQSSSDRIMAWDLGLAYNAPLMGHAAKFNIDYSAVHGDRTISQYVAGYNLELFNNFWTGLEYTYSKNPVSFSTVTELGPKSSALTFVATAYF